jgi:hypothetical protein
MGRKSEPEPSTAAPLPAATAPKKKKKAAAKKTEEADSGDE